MKALVLKLSSFGDIVHSFPALEVLSSIDGVEVYWVVDEAFRALLEGDPRIKRLIEVKKGHLKLLLKSFRWSFFLRGVRELISALRVLDVDVLFDLQGDLKSALISLFIKSPVKLTFPDASEGNPLLLKRVPSRPESVHVAERYLDVIRFYFTNLSIPKAPFAGPHVPQEVRERVLRDYGEVLSRRVVALIPATTWSSRTWLLERWERLSKALLDLGFYPVIIGGSDAMNFNIPGVLNLGGRLSLAEACAFLGMCTLAIGVDTGPTHLSASLGIPTISLFGPTPPWRNSPWGPKVKVIHNLVGCNPCRRRSCPSKLCMLSISVEEVLQAVNELSPLAF
ncbi:MAG: glycosyltransferase family 9 protein [Synergistetes bacterium]|nr:glycosyltransferase family 9 protein [Synergistota bacterium]MDW8191619.1 glycosyltransferase family 9 protein [Synergistota bacterium]